MAFETDEATVYQVRARHRNEEVREVVPSDYGGVMVTDRGRSYDAQALSGVMQQKCLNVDALALHARRQSPCAVFNVLAA